MVDKMLKREIPKGLHGKTVDVCLYQEEKVQNTEVKKGECTNVTNYIIHYYLDSFTNGTRIGIILTEITKE